MERSATAGKGGAAIHGRGVWDLPASQEAAPGSEAARVPLAVWSGPLAARCSAGSRQGVPWTSKRRSRGCAQQGN